MEEILNILKLHLFFSDEILEEDINKYVDANLVKNEESGYDEEGVEIVSELKLKKKIFEILKNDLVSLYTNIEKAIFFTIVDDDITEDDKKILTEEISVVKEAKRPDLARLCLDQLSRLKNSN